MSEWSNKLNTVARADFTRSYRIHRLWANHRALGYDPEDSLIKDPRTGRIMHLMVVQPAPHYLANLAADVVLNVRSYAARTAPSPGRILNMLEDKKGWDSLFGQVS